MYVAPNLHFGKEFGKEYLPDLLTLSFMLFLGIFTIYQPGPWRLKRYFEANYFFLLLANKGVFEA